MKKLNLLFVFALAATFAFVFPISGCGPYEHGNDGSGSGLTGAACKDDGDCAPDHFCVENTDFHVCLQDHCKNGIKDSDEVAQDKGGSCNVAYKVDNGGPCVTPADCNSNICSVQNVCVGRAGGEACTNGNQCQTQVCGADGLCTGNVVNTCTTNADCSSGQKVCFSGSPNYCGDCANDAQCGSGKVCNAGTCTTPNTTCGAGCSTGYVCVDNACVPGSAQNYLCATPQVAIVAQCWNQVTGGVVDATMTIPAGTTQCCPVASGSFTTNPVTTAGTYTGYQGTSVSRPFQSWSNNLGQTVSGGMK